MTPVKYYETGEDYEPIEIKWDTGFMIVAPPPIWKEHKSKAVSKFRKLLKLSIDSDRLHNTNAVHLWRVNLVKALEWSKVMRHYADARFQSRYEDIIKQSDKPDPKRGKKIREIQSSHKYELKLIDARDQKIIACRKVLDELVEKQKG